MKNFPGSRKPVDKSPGRIAAGSPSSGFRRLRYLINLRGFAEPPGARLVRSSFSLGVNPGCDLGDAHLFTPKCDGNDAGNLNRLLALPDGYRWRGRRNEGGSVCLCNDGTRLESSEGCRRRSQLPFGNL